MKVKVIGYASVAMVIGGYIVLWLAFARVIQVSFATGALLVVLISNACLLAEGAVATSERRPTIFDIRTLVGALLCGAALVSLPMGIALFSRDALGGLTLLLASCCSLLIWIARAIWLIFHGKKEG